MPFTTLLNKFYLLSLTCFSALIFLALPRKSFGQTLLEKSPKVDVHITLDKDTVTSQDSIRVTIKITNNDTKIQQLLFDKPLTGVGGPWHTTGDVINLKTGKSVVQLQNRAVLSSQIYLQKDLKDKYYHLKQGQSITATYWLTSILVCGNGVSMPGGDYEIRLTYSGNPSNIARFYIP